MKLGKILKRYYRGSDKITLSTIEIIGLVRPVLLTLALAILNIATIPDLALAQQKGDSKGKRVRDIAPQVTLHDKERAFNGYTIYPLEFDANVFLFSPDGKVVNNWRVDADRALLLPNCNLLVVHGTGWGVNRQPWKALRYVARELNWDGSTAWEYTAPDVVHHDLQRLENGNTLLLIRELFPPSISKLSDYSSNPNPLYNGDRIIEVTKDGKIVFDWKSSEAFPLDYCGRRVCTEAPGYGNPRRHFDWTHGNTATIIPENKWYRGGDKRFKPGNIAFMARNFWTAYIIDKETKEIVWKYVGDYKGGLGPAHEPHMIPEGYPGAGNMLIFNNYSPGHRGSTQILEINPVSQEIVWKYEAGEAFSSERSGSVQRLPNGNTLISEDKQGRAFEVTSSGEIVWEMKSKHEVNRARKYPIGYCPKLD